MTRFVEGEDRRQSTLFPERLDDYIAEDNPVRVIDAFVDALNLVELGFERAIPLETGRPGYYPATLLKIYTTATSIAFNPVAAWSERLSAMSR